MKKELLALTVLISLCRLATAQTSVLDATFGSGIPAGTAVFSGINAGSFDQGIAFQTDGKILVSSGENSGMARLNTNGSLDNSFGGGWVSAGNYAFGDIIVQGDGKILAAGNPTAISVGDRYIWRFKNDGTPDITFGQNGRAGDSSLGSGYGHILLQSGTKIIWSGALGLKRLNLADGSIDAGFGNSGFVRIAQLPLFPAAIALDNTTGNILVGGYTKVKSHLAIIRLTANGTVDASFGSNGVDSLALKATDLSPVMKISVNSSGKIIMVSDFDTMPFQNVVCVGFNANGSVDNSFGTNSRTIPDWNLASRGYTHTGGLALTGDDKILIAASVIDVAVSGNCDDIGIQRFNANGSPDAAFGIARLDINHSCDNVQAIAIAPDGKLVVNGSTGGKELVARYTTAAAGIQGWANDPLRLSIYPDPVQGHTTLRFTSAANSSVSAWVYAADGRLVARIMKDVKIPAGAFEKEINTASLAPGLYRIAVTAGNASGQILFQTL